MKNLCDLRCNLGLQNEGWKHTELKCQEPLLSVVCRVWGNYNHFIDCIRYCILCANPRSRTMSVYSLTKNFLFLNSVWYQSETDFL